GFMALAALVFSNGDPVPLLTGCILFGFADALAMRLQQFGIPSYLILTLPYVITLIVLFTISYIRRPQVFRETADTIKKYMSVEKATDEVN
ncbi:MAG: ABC transporter permease, partial [Halanaerobiaceae bacterium]